MVTECQPKPFAMDFGPPKGEVGYVCGRHGAELELSEQKYKVRGNVLLTFAAIKISSQLYIDIYAANLLWDIFHNFLPNFRLEGGRSLVSPVKFLVKQEGFGGGGGLKPIKWVIFLEKFYVSCLLMK